MSITEHTREWTPRSGDLVLVTQYGQLYYGILWDQSSTTIQFYNQWKWERLLDYLKGHADRPSVDYLRRYSRSTGQAQSVWRDKMVPCMNHHLDAGHRNILTNILTIMEKDLGPRDKRPKIDAL